VAVDADQFLPSLLCFVRSRLVSAELLLPLCLQYLHDFNEELTKHTFTDADKLSAWSQHGAYRMRDKLSPKDHDDPSRDFPEARQRLAEKKSLA
jgi:hypothetical protein